MVVVVAVVVARILCDRRVKAGMCCQMPLYSFSKHERERENHSSAVIAALYFA
jgi:hypothetical protein